MKINLGGIIILAAAILLAACSSDKEETPTKEPVYKVLTEATLKPGDPIPVPEGEAVLTVTGQITHPNQDNTIVMDLKTIEAVGQVEYAVHDPFEDQTVTYQGVLMSDLLKVWGADPAATTLSVLALNDYQVNVSVADMQKYPVIFALRRNGEYMPVSTRGPAMLVFPYDDFEFDHTVYNDFWAWQIKSIDIH